MRRALTPWESPISANRRARRATRLPRSDAPSGAVAADNNRRRIKSRTTSDVVSTGRRGNKMSTNARLVPSHMATPKPPSAGLKVPTESAFKVRKESTWTLGDDVLVDDDERPAGRNSFSTDFGTAVAGAEAGFRSAAFGSSLSDGCNAFGGISLSGVWSDGSDSWAVVIKGKAKTPTATEIKAARTARLTLKSFIRNDFFDTGDGRRNIPGGQEHGPANDGHEQKEDDKSGQISHSVP